MMNAHLSFKPLESALASLKRSVDLTEKLMKDPSTTLDHKEILQAGVIQHFEFCYELSWKMLKKKLALVASNAALVDTFSFQELIREGAQRGYIADAARWLRYRHQRNLTSHIYHAKTAEQVYQTAITFYSDAIDLLNRLQK